MEMVQDKNSRIGLIGSLLIHLILLLLFLFFGMTYFDPPPLEEGITINFGTSTDGMGEQQVQSNSDAVPNETQEQPEEVQDVTEKVLTQNTTETVDIAADKKVEAKPVSEPEKISDKLSEALNALDNVEKESDSEGETGKSGDQGAMDGDVNSSNHSGGEKGNGATYSLAGRSLKSTPRIKDNSQEEGKVVVEIVVDKYGRVIKAVPGGRGSTTTSPVLYKKAKEAALKTRFSSKPDTDTDQKGKMMFVFVLNG